MTEKERMNEAGSAFGDLRAYKYCQLVTFRRTGEAVETPIWFAIDGDRLFVKTEDPSGKIKRIRREPHVRVAPCTVTGRHLGPPLEGVARILPAAEEPRAEVALRRRYALGRRLFSLLIEPLFTLRGLRHVYLEIVPAAERQPVSGYRAQA